MKNRSMPPGTLIPELLYDDMPAAVAWLCATFGFTERLRIGAHRTQMLIGAGTAFVAVQRPAGAPTERAAPGCSLMVRVGDAGGHYARALAHGARIIAPPANYPYGERQYTAEDPGGFRWTFSQAIEDIEPATWGGVLVDG